MTENEEAESNWIAVIGYAGRFPDAQTVDQLWENLMQEKESVTPIGDDELKKLGVPSKLLNSENYIKFGVSLEAKDCFDADFFNISSTEAKLTDPQQRLLLETAYHAMEHGGYPPCHKTYNAGVFFSADPSSYFLEYFTQKVNTINAQDAVQLTYANNDTATKTSYHLNLSGPSLNINTACSSSLVSVHQACRSLMLYECDMALAGGASIYAKDPSGYEYQEGGVYSKDGHCRAFDHNASGTITGEGVGVVLLKRYEDAIKDNDIIHAVILGSAINNDGNSKISYTAPSVEGQKNVIRQALNISEIDPSSVRYIECHGTGTKIGDAIELTALSETYGLAERDTESQCILGSIKTNIGHLNSASGIAGFIKTIMILKQKHIPATLHFKKFNPQYHFDLSGFCVINKTQPWAFNTIQKHAAVSSFGIGGTNAHIILAEHQEDDVDHPQCSIKTGCLPFVLSAQSPTALKAKISALHDYLCTHQEIDLGSLSYTLSCRKNHFPYRFSLSCETIKEAITETTNALKVQEFVPSETPQKIILLFPADRGQHLCNAGRELYETHPVFQHAIKKCAQLFEQKCGLQIIDLLYPEKTLTKDKCLLLEKNIYSQPILFSLGYALFQCCESLDLQIDGVFGFSFGEYMAAFAAGVMNLDDITTLICKRSNLMDLTEEGFTLSVFLSINDIQKYLKESVVVSEIQSPQITVISGPAKDLSTVINQLDKNGVSYIIRQSKYAFHSPLMKRVSDSLEKEFETISLNEPKLEYISSVTGQNVGQNEVTLKEYWLDQLTKPVQAQKAMETILCNSDYILLEIGDPKSTLSQTVQMNAINQNTSPNIIHALKRGFTKAVLTLWKSGADINFNALYAKERNLRFLPILLYPFDQTSYWFESNTQTTQLKSNTLEDSHKDNLEPNELQIEILNIWTELLGRPNIKVTDNFFKLGGHSLIAIQILNRINSLFNIKLQIEDLLNEPTIIGIESAMLEQQLKNFEKEN